MKILYLLPYLPTPADFSEAVRTYYTLKYLVENHEVYAAGFCDKGEPELFRVSFPELKENSHFVDRPKLLNNYLLPVFSLLSKHSYWFKKAQSKQLQKLLNELLEKENYDFVIIESQSMGHFKLKTRAKRILNAHYVEYETFRRMSIFEQSPLKKAFYKREYEKRYAEELNIFQNQDAIFSTSSVDAQIIKEHAPYVPSFVIPNGVDTSYYSSKNSYTEPWSMVFTGDMGYVPNYDSMIKFLKVTFPLIKKEIPHAVIYIVGKNPPEKLLKYQSDAVFVTGLVDDFRPFIDESEVYVAPLTTGTGPAMNILKALSMKKPVVTTSAGCKGIEAKDQFHLIIRDDPADFAKAVVHLFKNKLLQKKISENARILVTEKYDWHVTGGLIDDAFNQLKSQNVWA